MEDAPETVALAAEHYNKPAPVNIRAGEETTIRALAEQIFALCDFWGAIRWESSQPDGKPRSFPQPEGVAL